MASPLLAPPAAPQPKFKVVKALGKGSYGTVYKVTRLADGGTYAMKETDLAGMDARARADAVNEIRLLGSLDHPNIVRHHETFLSGPRLCIVMEYAPAGDLAAFLRAAAAARLPLPEATVWQILLQLCQGLQAIHAASVIHRDIKPANIFMAPGNVVKIGDLGVAKALTRAAHAQTVIGTPLYMAPEVWRGLRYSTSSDLWSLGGVLYEMMAHRLPFDARSLNELKNKIILGSYAPLAPGAPYSPGLVAIAHGLLSKDPGRRPGCAAILNSREAAPWLHTIPEAVRCPLPPLDVPGLGPAALGAARGGGGAALLPTIQVPRDIRLLPHRLPKPNYDAAGSGEGNAGAGADAAKQPAPTPAPAVAAAPAPVPRAPAPVSAGAAAFGAPPRSPWVAAGVPAPGARVPAAAAPSSRAGVPVRPASAGKAGAPAAVVAVPGARARAPVVPPYQQQPFRGGGGGGCGFGLGGYAPPGGFRAASPAAGLRAASPAAGGARAASPYAAAPGAAHLVKAAGGAGRVAGVGVVGGGGGQFLGARPALAGGGGAMAGFQQPAAGVRAAGRPSPAPVSRPGGGWPY